MTVRRCKKNFIGIRTNSCISKGDYYRIYVNLQLIYDGINNVIKTQFLQYVSCHTILYLSISSHLPNVSREEISTRRLLLWIILDLLEQISSRNICENQVTSQSLNTEIIDFRFWESCSYVNKLKALAEDFQNI